MMDEEVGMLHSDKPMSRLGYPTMIGFVVRFLIKPCSLTLSMNIATHLQV